MNPVSRALSGSRDERADSLPPRRPRRYQSPAKDRNDLPSVSPQTGELLENRSSHSLSCRANFRQPAKVKQPRRARSSSAQEKKHQHSTIDCVPDRWASGGSASRGRHDDREANGLQSHSQHGCDDTGQDGRLQVTILSGTPIKSGSRHCVDSRKSEGSAPHITGNPQMKELNCRTIIRRSSIGGLPSFFATSKKRSQKERHKVPSFQPDFAIQAAPATQRGSAPGSLGDLRSLPRLSQLSPTKPHDQSKRSLFSESTHSTGGPNISIPWLTR
jgi:hypothetical protein